MGSILLALYVGVFLNDDGIFRNLIRFTIPFESSARFTKMSPPIKLEENSQLVIIVALFEGQST